MDCVAVSPLRKSAKVNEYALNANIANVHLQFIDSIEY